MTEQRTGRSGSSRGDVRHGRADVVRHALRVLDAYGLESLTMRRLAGELGVQPSALYHHFPNKQRLLAAVAEAILADRNPPAPGEWDTEVQAICADLRAALLSYRDGAEVVATTWSFGLGARGPYDALVARLARSHDDPVLVDAAARTLLHFVLGHVVAEQTHTQAASVGAVDTDIAVLLTGTAATYDLGVALILDGLRARAGEESGVRR